MVHLESLKRVIKPKLAISENVPNGDINLRIVERLEEDMDSRVPSSSFTVIYMFCFFRAAHAECFCLSMFASETGFTHHFQVIFGEPSDIGFTCISRWRTFQIFLRRDAGRFIREPAAVYQRLCAGLGDKHLTLPELCKLVQEGDLQDELAFSGKSVDGYPGNFVSSFERENQKRYEELLGSNSPDLAAFCLNQNPAHMNRSTHSGLLPTFTKQDKIVWLAGQNRHLLAIEKFAGHGFGVKPELAALLKTPASWRQLYNSTRVVIYGEDGHWKHVR